MLHQFQQTGAGPSRTQLFLAFALVRPTVAFTNASAGTGVHVDHQRCQTRNAALNRQTPGQLGAGFVRIALKFALPRTITNQSLMFGSMIIDPVAK